MTHASIIATGDMGQAIAGLTTGGGNTVDLIGPRPDRRGRHR